MEIPVNLLFDQIYPPPSLPSELIADRFQVLEMDGYYLTIHEALYDGATPDTQEFKCFATIEEAFDYLERFGVDRPCEDREDCDREWDPEDE